MTVAIFIALIALSIPRGHLRQLGTCAMQALRFFVVCLAAVLVEEVAAYMFLRPRDVRTWHWMANTIRILHPLAWLMLIMSFARHFLEGHPDHSLGGCTLWGAACCAMSAGVATPFGPMVIWLLLPALSPCVSSFIMRVLRADMCNYNKVAVCVHYTLVFISLLLFFDNALSWIPPFLFYVDSMSHARESTPVGISEVLASIIWILAAVLIWPLLHYMRPHEVKVFSLLSVAFLVAITISEVAIPTCKHCPYEI
eukprot:gnl/TRDRNA2_/TRDRNA2_60747_c0_seq1.p1 gnl/TRDRNA2_/TRDRNA2_60747_c0~~gnl/TRDRNA2_/TRDRNA2_60747_c0_seq1.p1  ORF type:complete len:286 (+),score=24.58 gnl/TRDRNA2_/TRDRNA2_60747_c0_seq1:98-859(+)